MQANFTILWKKNSRLKQIGYFFSRSHKHSKNLSIIAPRGSKQRVLGRSNTQKKTLLRIF